MLVRRTNLAPPVQQPHRSSSSPVVQPNTSPAASFMQHHHSSPIPTTTVVQPPQSSPIPTDPAVQSPQCSPDGAGPSRNGDANHISHDDLVMFSSLFNFFSSSPMVIFNVYNSHKYIVCFRSAMKLYSMHSREMNLWPREQLFQLILSPCTQDKLLERSTV